MGLLGQGLLPGHDWLALFTPSERPGPSSVPPSRHHALVLGLIGLVHRRASRLAAIAARPRPASTRTALEVSICCPGLVCWQHFPLATDPTVASNPESRSTAIIVLVCLVGLTNRHPRTNTTFSSCTILFSAFGLCLHSEAHIPTIFCASVHPYHQSLPLGAVVPRRPGPRAPDPLCLLPAQNGKRNSPSQPAVRLALQHRARLSACPPVATRPKTLQGPVRSSHNPPIRSRLFTLPAPEGIRLSDLRQDRRPQPDRCDPSISSPPPLSHGSTPTEHRTPSTAHTTPSATPHRGRVAPRHRPSPPSLPCLCGRNESMSTAN